MPEVSLLMQMADLFEVSVDALLVLRAKQDGGVNFRSNQGSDAYARF
jgi:predicted Rdx family selenoprotein